MHYLSKTQSVSRHLVRGLATGLLFTQLALNMSAQVAPAQDSTATTTDDKKEKVFVLEEYKVTGGFRGSLAAAAEKKENNQAIVEVIASEDIGKLPDVSIADALTRLTGLTTQRQNGRAQAISIRGLTGDFSTGMLNGREQVSAGENRAVEFDQFPAELLNGVVVYKTAAANLTGQGLAGTVDLQTVQPLSRSGRTISMSGYYQTSAYGQLTPGAKGTGDRFNLTYIDQVDKTMGFAIGFSHTDNPYAGKQFAAWGYPQDANGNYALGGTKAYVRSSNLARDGLVGVFEFKPSENVHSTIDVFYSDFKEKQYLRGLEIPLAFWSGANLQSGYTVNNGMITQSTLTNVQPVVRNDGFQRTSKPLSVGWNLKVGEKSEWPITLDAGYSKITRTDMNLESWSGLGSNGGAGANADTMTETLHPGNVPTFTTKVDYTNTSLFSVTDPQGWQTWIQPQGGPGWLKYLKANDKLGQYKISTEHEMKTLFKSVEAGLSYTDRSKFEGEGPSGLPSNSNGLAKAPLPSIVGTTDFSYLGVGKIYAYDPFAWINSSAVNFIPDPSPDFVARQFQVNEKITQIYTQGNFDNKIGSVPVTGNLGVRAVGADQSSSGYSANGTTLTPVSGSSKYWDFAPNLNLNFLVGDQTYLRFSAARQIARPRMYDLRSGRNWGYDPSKAASTDVNNSPWSAGEAGNINLRPWRANSLDLSFEKYFSENKGYFAITAFTKKLLNFIYTQSKVVDFTGYPIKGAVTPAIFKGIASTPANGQGGDIRGIETTLSLASEMISKDIKGFGLIIGGAYTDSTVQPWGPGNGTAPLAGLSRKVANATLYYERHGFSARISERYRSETREYITQFGVPNRGGDVGPNGDFNMAEPEKVVDAQVSYALQSGPAKGLTFFIQAYNLNNEPQITLQSGDPRRVMNYQTYGASYSFGAAYKF